MVCFAPNLIYAPLNKTLNNKSSFEGHIWANYNIPCAQGVPGSIDVCVEVLLRGLPSAHTVA